MHAAPLTNLCLKFAVLGWGLIWGRGANSRNYVVERSGKEFKAHIYKRRERERE